MIATQKPERIGGTVFGGGRVQPMSFIGEATASLSASDRLIVALDVSSQDEALEIVSELDGLVSFFKVGYQLFIAQGMEFVKQLAGQGKRVFLDLKMDDVDETIKSAVEAISKVGVKFITIHGNGATVRAARNGRGNREFPKLLMLTVLTSLDETDLRDMMIVGKRQRFKTLEEYAVWRAKHAVDAGCDGLIAAGPNVRALRKQFGGGKIIVTAGIRPEGTNPHDHKRPSTPHDAILAGADYLVVGRPIRYKHGTQRRQAAESIITEIDSTLRSLRKT